MPFAVSFVLYNTKIFSSTGICDYMYNVFYMRVRDRADDSRIMHYLGVALGVRWELGVGG